MANYYNEIDPYAAQWLRNLIKNKLIPDGDVDERSIVDVQPMDLIGYKQCHFFAGIGGWSRALQLAGWPDDRAVWTGSCPCQPFSVAGKGLGADDPRHLWPHYLRLVAARRPAVVMGEQVAGAAGYGWLDGVRADLAREGYASRGVDIPACAVDAPHIRSRLYWVASDMADADLRQSRAGRGDDGEVRGVQAAQRRAEDGAVVSARGSAADGDMADAGRAEWRPQSEARRHDDDRADAGWQEATGGHQLGRAANGTFWSDAVWLTGADGKARRAQPGLPLLAHGVPARVGRLRAYGNAVVPQLAAEVIGAFMDCGNG